MRALAVVGLGLGLVVGCGPTGTVDGTTSAVSPPARAEPTAGGEHDGPLPLVITALDVGQGDAILIDFGHRTQTDRGPCRVEWLLDAGPSGNRIAPLLNRLDCELDAFVLSHPHTDHFAGAERLLNYRFEGRPVVLEVLGNGEARGPPRDPEEPSSWQRLREALERAQIEPVGLLEGQVLHPAPDVEVRVLWSGTREGGHFADTDHGPDINNDSLVLMIELAGRRVLLTGDTETEAQAQILERYCTPSELAGEGPCAELRADVLKVPHHGSDHVDPRFFRAVAPEVALISAGHRNRQYHHPRAEVVERLLDLGAEVRSTSAEGELNAWVEIGRDGSLAAHGPEEVFAWRDGPGGWEEVLLPTARH